MAIKVISNQLYKTQVLDDVFLSKKISPLPQVIRNRSIGQFLLRLSPQNWFRELSDIKITMEEFQHTKASAKKE